MANNNFRVKLPRKAEELLTLMTKILAKHTADGAASKLSALNMTLLGTINTDAKVLHDKVVQMRKDLENLTEQRDQLLGIDKGQTLSTEGTGLHITAQVRDLLLGVNKGKEQQLGDHGFVVDKSPKAKKSAAPTA